MGPDPGQCSHGLAGVSSASCDSISCVITAGHRSLGPGSGDGRYSTEQYSTVQHLLCGHRWSPVTWTRIWRLQIQYRIVQYSTRIWSLSRVRRQSRVAAADAAGTDGEGSGECLVCLRRSRRWMDGDINL